MKSKIPSGFRIITMFELIMGIIGVSSYFMFREYVDIISPNYQLFYLGIFLFMIIAAILTSFRKKFGRICQFALATVIILIITIILIYVGLAVIGLDGLAGSTQSGAYKELTYLIIFVLSWPAMITSLTYVFLIKNRMLKIVPLALFGSCLGYIVYLIYNFGLNEYFATLGLLFEIAILLIIYFTRPGIKKLFVSS
jgi:hypothetical protein